SPEPFFGRWRPPLNARSRRRAVPRSPLGRSGGADAANHADASTGVCRRPWPRTWLTPSGRPGTEASMLGTLVRRIAVNTLDTVIERGKGADVAPVRWAADTLDHVRVRVGLDRVERTAPLPAWTGAHPDRPMWESDRQKLRKHQIERGILPPEDQNTGAAASSTVEQAPDLDSAAIKIFYKRGCPYARAALDLLRERDYSFDAQD